jgi:hypothetical protein
MLLLLIAAAGVDDIGARMQSNPFAMTSPRKGGRWPSDG